MVRVLSRDEFKRKWDDTHTELQASELLSSNCTLIKESSGDKNITQNYRIPGKNIIEARAIEARANNLRDMLLDAVDVRRDELLEMPMTHLLKHTVDIIPKKVENKHEHNFTFASMVARASDEEIIDV